MYVNVSIALVAVLLLASYIKILSIAMTLF